MLCLARPTVRLSVATSSRRALSTASRRALSTASRRALSTAPQADVCPRQTLTHLLEEGTYYQRDFAARLAAAGKSPNEVSTSLQAIFESVDRQGEGALSLSGVADAIRQVKERCPLAHEALDPVTAMRHLELADTNQDGVVSFAEFNNYVTHHVLERANVHHQRTEAEARRRSNALLSRNALLERRVDELAPGIRDHGMHANRQLLFGGASPAADALLMRSNDYLGLSGHPMIAAARAEAMVSEGGREEARARVFTLAEMDRHRALELRLAKLLHTEDAAITFSGAHATIGLLRTLRGQPSAAAAAARLPIYTDRLSWSTAAVRDELGTTPFAHNNMRALEALASDEPGIIVVDAVYGNGALGDLAGAAEVAAATGSVLVVDETHAFGVAEGGLGLVDELGLADAVHFRTIGFSKAMAARGGAIVGPSRALEAFRFNDPTMIFSTAPKAHEAVGWDATLDVLLQEPWRRERVHACHAALKAGLIDLGLEGHVAPSSRQIVPIVTGDAETTIAFRDACAARGLFGAVFAPPFAPAGGTYVRFSVHCGLSDEDIERFLACMREVRHLLPPREA